MVPAPVGLSLYIGDETSPGLADGTGRAARFNTVFAVTLAANGDAYVIDQKPSGPRNPVVRRITPQGVVTTLPKACYADPRDLAMGGDGHLYVLEYNRICRQTVSGEFAEVATSASLPAGTATYFYTLARGPGSDLYVATLKAVYRLTPGGTLSFVAGQELSSPTLPLNPTDGPGATASFNAITGITSDAAGNVYVGDGGYGIRKVTPQGVVSTVARIADVPQPPGDLTYLFDFRLGLAAQADGSVILAGAPFGNASALRRISPGGEVSTVPGGDKLPRDLAALATDAAGNITYTVVKGVGRLLPDGRPVQLAGGGLPGPGEPTLEAPAAVDAAGNVYTLLRPFNQRSVSVRKRAPTGELLSYAPGLDIVSLAPPEENMVYTPVAVAGDGTIYASYLRQRPRPAPPSTEYYEVEIYKVTPAGATTRILFAQIGSANFAAPGALAPAPDGTLYFTDVQRLAVRKLNTDGSVVSVTPDGELARAHSSGTNSHIGVSPTGKVYVSDPLGEQAIYTVNAAGRFELVAGRTSGTPQVVDGTGTAAAFIQPSAPAFDEQGNLYVVDNLQLLRRVTPAGVVTTLAGTAGSKETRLGPLPGALTEAFGLARGPEGVFYLRSGQAIVRVRLP